MPGLQQCLRSAFISQERRDERNPKIQSRIQSNGFFFFLHIYECINQLTGTPEGSQACRKAAPVVRATGSAGRTRSEFWGADPGRERRGGRELRTQDEHRQDVGSFTFGKQNSPGSSFNLLLIPSSVRVGTVGPPRSLQAASRMIIGLCTSPRVPGHLVCCSWWHHGWARSPGGVLQGSAAVPAVPSTAPVLAHLPALPSGHPQQQNAFPEATGKNLGQLFSLQSDGAFPSTHTPKVCAEVMQMQSQLSLRGAWDGQSPAASGGNLLTCLENSRRQYRAFSVLT